MNLLDWVCYKETAWIGRLVVYTSGLLNRRGRKPPVGSNPTLSAMEKFDPKRTADRPIGDLKAEIRTRENLRLLNEEKKKLQDFAMEYAKDKSAIGVERWKKCINALEKIEKQIEQETEELQNHTTHLIDLMEKQKL